MTIFVAREEGKIQCVSGFMQLDAALTVDGEAKVTVQETGEQIVVVRDENNDLVEKGSLQ